MRETAPDSNTVSVKARPFYKTYPFWIGIVVSVLLLCLFLFQNDFSDMGKAFTEANYLFLIPALAVYLIGVLFRAIRWHYLLRPIKKISPFRLFTVIIIGFLVNNVLPARLGLVARAVILGQKYNISKVATIGTMVVEQVFDGMALLFYVAVISLVVSLGGLLGGSLYLVAGIFLIAMGFCFLLALSPGLARRLITFLARFLPGWLKNRIEAWMGHFIQGFGVLRSPFNLAIVFILSLVVWLFEGLTFYLVSIAFKVGQPYHVLLLVTAVANLAWVLLVTPGGLGPFDLAAQQTLVFFGVKISVATPFVLVLHAVIMLPVIAAGLLLLGRESISIAQVMSQKNTELAGGPQSPEKSGGKPV